MSRQSLLAGGELAANRAEGSGRLRSITAALASVLATILAVPASGAEVDERTLDDLIRRMSVADKLGQLQQFGTDGNTGELLKGQEELLAQGQIGSFINARGARYTNRIQRIAIESSPLKIPVLFGYDVIHGYRTIFPAPLGMASSWDMKAIEQASAIAAREASAAGVRWVFAPMVDIARDPRWGRIIEGAGEDPYLGSRAAAAQVRGLQGATLGEPGHVAACVKHWVAYGAAEGGRDYNSSEVSERTLRGVYFPPFRAALDAGVGSFMTALNELDGEPATVNSFTLGQVLRKEWKFDGVVLSDYQAVEQLIDHGVAKDGEAAAQMALKAGIDVEEQSEMFRKHGATLLQEGKVSQARLDQAVRRILRLKMKLGLFEKPYVDEAIEHAEILCAGNLAAAREVAGRSMVLLRNEGEILPLKPDVQSIAVIGPMAVNPQDPLGPWFADGKKEETVTLLAGIKARAAKAPNPPKVAYAKGCEAVGDSREGFDEALRVARESDVVILAIGEPSDQSGEAASLASLDLPGQQLALAQAIKGTGKPIAVVLLNGRPLTIGWVAENIPAILEAWYPGSQAGNAVADILFGDVNPGGKLPLTFPKTVGQIPLYYNHMNTGRPAGDFKYTSKYADIGNQPLYSFGFGLSYTRFKLDNLALSAKTIPVGGRLEVSVEVENVGPRAGDEVVQLYLRDEVASVTRPVKELRGFERIRLEPGERRTVRFTLETMDLGFYDRENRFCVELGRFKVTVGDSSEGGLDATFELVRR
ncbi:glycoside hydrolase family 3 N-terminal domain-containing protein [Singulisphaera sp. PoT]|uniref:glycoside hydrolase family 3 N-terminal domain-containing protein n=1 Tax=Singulisphaera sp. PoT TaxID=3411797 RepID=UPI003BF51567